MGAVTSLDYSTWTPVLKPEAAKSCTHALESGQIILPPHLSAMQEQALSPLRTLERMVGRALA